MSGHIAAVNFDPHAEAIDGPTPDPWAPTVRDPKTTRPAPQPLQTR